MVIPAPRDCIQQIGFDEEDALFPNDSRVFRGSELLREYFVFPRKFLAFNLVGLRAIMPRLRSKSVDIVLAFDKHDARLAASVRADTFSLYTAPAINLFEKTSDRIPIKSNTHEYHVVPDRSRYLEYEPHRVLDVYAHYPGGTGQGSGQAALFGVDGQGRRRGRRLVLYGPAPAAPAHRRRKGPRRDLGLCRHRHVHLAAASRGN